MMICVTGGSGSGKSSWAERFLEQSYTAVKSGHNHSVGKLYYIATMESESEEAKERIRRHVRLRSGKGFTTIECPHDLRENIKQSEELYKNAFVLLECTGNLFANNLFMAGKSSDEAVADLCGGIALLRWLCHTLVVVHNEVGEGKCLYSGLVRTYIDGMDAIGEILSRESDAAVTVIAGMALHLPKSGLSAYPCRTICPIRLPLNETLPSEGSRGAVIRTVCIVGADSDQASVPALLNELHIEWKDGETIGISDLSEADGILHLERLVHRLLEREDAPTHLSADDTAYSIYCRLVSDRVHSGKKLSILCKEVGRTVVASDRRRRYEREVVGRLCILLMEAARSGAYVYSGKLIRLKPERSV